MTQSDQHESAAPPLNSDQQTMLLQMAHDTITLYLSHGRMPQYQSADPALLQIAGVFVTLRTKTKGDDMPLRGCIGRVEAERPLLYMVPEMAVKAATNDPRFPPVTAVELPLLHIEISLLSPLQPLNDPETVLVGTQGLLIEGHGRRGLLLPDVPLHHGWDRHDFLEGICQKAGLPPASGAAQATLYTFTTFSFEDG